MIRLIKKWWMLEHLRREIARHSRKASLEDLSHGGSVLVTQWFFIAGSPNHPEYPGLAQKAAKRWWRHKPGEERVKERIQVYNDLFTAAVKEGYIEMVPTSAGQQMPSVATPKADAISGWFGLIQKLLTEYYLAWSIIIFPLALGVYGSPFLRSIIRRLIEVLA